MFDRQRTSAHALRLLMQWVSEHFAVHCILLRLLSPIAVYFLHLPSSTYVLITSTHYDLLRLLALSTYVRSFHLYVHHHDARTHTYDHPSKDVDDYAYD